jgi:peptide/nickel transport system ATP-binding protein
MTPAVLHVDRLRVEYAGSRRRRKGVVAVNDVSFEIKAGEALGIVGESGSGKTTIARAVLGLVPPSGGRVQLGEDDVTTRPAALRGVLSSRMQAVFQDPYTSFNPLRTVGQSLVEPVVALKGLSRAEAENRVTDLLVQVGLGGDALNRYPHVFSGGQLQRIAIARALAVGPSLVVCDEAVSSLDVSTQAQVLQLLDELRNRTQVAFMFIGHDLGVVRFISQRMIVLYGGEIMESGPSDAVTLTPRHPYTQALVAAAPVTDVEAQRRRRLARRMLLGNGTSDATLNGCAYASRCPHVAPVCVTRRPRRVEIGAVSVACHRYDPSSEHPDLLGEAVDSLAPDT